MACCVIDLKENNSTEEGSGAQPPFNLDNQDSLPRKELVENYAKECLAAATKEVGSVSYDVIRVRNSMFESVKKFRP